MRSQVSSLLLATVVFSSAPQGAAKTTQHSIKRGPAIETPKPKTVTYYDFKGARLGMTLEEWKALPVPRNDGGLQLTGTKVDAPQPICAGDAPTVGSDTITLTGSPPEDTAHVLVCGYVYHSSSKYSDDWSPVAILIGGYVTPDVKYKFLDGKLYSIALTGAAGMLSDVMEGLRAKWGEPSSTVNDTTQNKLGATFPHSVTMWENPAAVIKVEAPFGKIDELGVTYMTIDGASKILSIEKAAHPDAEKM